MLGRKLADGFQFDDDLLETDEVRRIALSQQLTFVPELEWPKADKWNSARGELEPKTFLIDRLKKASAERSLHFEDGAPNSEGFLGWMSSSSCPRIPRFPRLPWFPTTTLAVGVEKNNKGTLALSAAGSASLPLRGGTSRW